jgi:hypothetical protein
MNTTVAIVWILVTVGGYNGDQVVYSPPMPTREACESLKRAAQVVRGTCVQYQMSTVVSK